MSGCNSTPFSEHKGLVCYGVIPMDGVLSRGGGLWDVEPARRRGVGSARRGTKGTDAPANRLTRHNHTVGSSATNASIWYSFTP